MPHLRPPTTDQLLTSLDQRVSRLLKEQVFLKYRLDHVHHMLHILVRSIILDPQAAHIDLIAGPITEQPSTVKGS